MRVQRAYLQAGLDSGRTILQATLRSQGRIGKTIYTIFVIFILFSDPISEDPCIFNSASRCMVITGGINCIYFLVCVTTSFVDHLARNWKNNLSATVTTNLRSTARCKFHCSVLLGGLGHGGGVGVVWSGRCFAKAAFNSKYF